MTTTTSFFRGGVTIEATYDTTQLSAAGVLTDTINGLPVERYDVPPLQEFFREDGVLSADITVTAAFTVGEPCEATLTVPFRTWAQIDETGGGLAPEDLALPDHTWASLDSAVAADMTDLLVSNTYFVSGAGSSNYTLTQLPLTGTPLQFTRVGEALYDQWDSQHELSAATTLNCSDWIQGRELVITQAYPNLSQAVNIVFGEGEQVEGFSYTQVNEEGLPSDSRTWLHHNCVLDPFHSDGDTAQLYSLTWGEAVGEGNVWTSNVGRFTINTADGSLVGGVESVVDAEELIVTDFRYGNGLSLSPAGSDGQRWLGVSYANNLECAFYLALPLTEDGDGEPRFMFVNEDGFEESRLASGWQSAFPELEVVYLPNDPSTDFFPVDFPHNIEFFERSDGVYRLIIGNLGGTPTSNDSDKRAEVYVYDVTVPEDGGAASASLFCGLSMDVETQSHFDFVLPRVSDPSWVGAFTSNPYGELFWLDLRETDDNQRCRVVGAQSHSTSINTNNTAQPIWSKEIDPRELFGSRIADVTIRYDAAALEPALAK